MAGHILTQDQINGVPMYGHIVGEMAAVTETVCSIDCDRLIDTCGCLCTMWEQDLQLKLYLCKTFTIYLTQECL